MDQEIADRLARIEERLERLELQIGDLAQGQSWLLGRFRVPASYLDRTMSEEWL
jgi:hypothetical protein